MTTEQSLFTKIINREIPAQIVFEDDLMIAIHDIHPKAPVHILVISKEPLESLAAVQQTHEALLGKMMLRVAAIAREFGIDKTGYKVITNSGADGGQVIPHLHIHLLGGSKVGGTV